MISAPSKQVCQVKISDTARASRRSSIGFAWEGFDEMDEVLGDGSAERLDGGSIEIEFAYHNGNEAVLKAKRETSSTAARLAPVKSDGV